tara:strand:+ start:142 stop:978 length:837 start_codon:yes stop_codon:yes gene_type:complete
MQIGGLQAKKVRLKGPKTYHIPSWKWQSDPRRVAALRKIVLEYGRDPRVATTAVGALKAAKVEPREYKKQAAALLAFVQHNIYYVNEPGERLQSPEYTLRVGYGDCDDVSILLASLYESVRLPWRFVLSGTHKASGKTVRWVEGTTVPNGVKWAHIYVTVGRPTFRPTRWSFAEPSLKGAPLGWDVVFAKQRGEKIPVPELGALGVTVDLTPSGAEPTSMTEQFKLLKTELIEGLHWRKLIVRSIVGSVTTVITGLIVKRLFFDKKKTKPRKRRRNYR